MIKIVPATANKSSMTPSNIRLLPKKRTPTKPIILGDKFFLIYVYLMSKSFMQRSATSDLRV